ncbi:hypothetical protein NXS19_010056 [Fusarium pseudograminearum]|nr:hypothetical protein NXS19_010056 [Fusarium pseudograminearum]
MVPPPPPKPKLKRIPRPKPNTISIWQPGHAHCPPQSAILDSLKRSLNIVRTLTFDHQTILADFASQPNALYRHFGSVPSPSASSPGVAIRLSCRCRAFLFPPIASVACRQFWLSNPPPIRRLSPAPRLELNIIIDYISTRASQRIPAPRYLTCIINIVTTIRRAYIS